MIKKIDWCDECEKGFLVSAGEDLAQIAWECRNGISQVWKMSGEAEALIVTRLEKNIDFDELVIVLGEGEGFKYVIPFFFELKESLGAKYIRTHVTRKGLIRLYEREGFVQSEVVMRYG